MCDERRGDHADSNWLDSCRSYSSRFSGVWWQLLAQFEHHHAVTVRNSVLLLQCSVHLSRTALIYANFTGTTADFECVSIFCVRHLMNLQGRGPTDNLYERRLSWWHVEFIGVSVCIFSETKQH